MSQIPTLPPEKPLGLWLLTALVTGNMIGSGIFSLPAPLAAYGSISLLAWVFTTLGALLIALVFAKLGAVMPCVGGPYAYCREGFGDFIGFQIAYSYWIGTWVGNAAIAVSATSYLSFFFPWLVKSPTLACGLSIGIVWFFTLINGLGVRCAGILQLLTTILKLLPLLLIAAVGLLFIQPSHFASFNLSHQSNLSAFTGAATLTAWSFLGLESASIPVNNIRDPQRNIPRATILGLAITAIVYILSTVAVMGVVPLSQLAHLNAPYAEAANIIFGPTGSILVAIGAIIACLGALNGWVLLQGQIPFAAAQDRLFPASFLRESRQGVPIVGLVVSSVLITLLLLLQLDHSLVQQFAFISLLGTLTMLIPYLFTTVAELLIFIKYPAQFNNGNSLIRSVIIAILASIYSFWTIVGSGQEIVYYGSLLLLSSLPAYAWMKWRA